MAVLALSDRIPVVSDKVWVADNAVVVGSVTLEAEVNVWFNAVIRADHDPVHIGQGTNIQDSAVLHTDDGHPLVLGERVTVGHMAMLHGCTVGDGTLIGINAVVLNGAKIGKHCLIGANTLIPEGKSIPDRSLVVGTPGRIIRELSDEEIAHIDHGAQHYIQSAELYRQTLRPIPLP